MEWLRIQLQIIRERGMKAILMGHVPPARVDSKESWDETCWQKYTLWERQFRDVIVGSLYGHMNIDHFMLQDFDQISKDADSGKMASGSSMSGREREGKIALYEDGEVTVASASDYLLDLREAWGRLPAPPPKSTKHPRARATELGREEDEGSSIWSWFMSKIKKHSGDKSEKKKYLDMIGGKFAERYSVTLVAPSVVPNYYPTLRIVQYNITGLENTRLPSSYSNSRDASSRPDQQPLANSEDLDDDEYYMENVKTAIRKKKKPKKGPRKYKFRVPDGPSKSSPPGPAYSPQVFTWTRYTQYFANLTHINNDFIETNDTVSQNEHSPSTIFGLNVTEGGQIESSGWKEGKHGKHQGKQPRPEPHPNEFVFEIEYDTKEDHKFPDLTVRRWVEYARKIGQNKAKAVECGQTSEDTAEPDPDDGNQSEVETSVLAQKVDEDEDGVKDMGKKHKKKRKHHKASKEWYTFVKRAFVGTMSPHEIKQLFHSPAPVETPDQTPEIVEL
jgi:endopolyphosphatase